MSSGAPIYSSACGRPPLESQNLNGWTYGHDWTAVKSLEKCAILALVPVRNRRSRTGVQRTWWVEVRLQDCTHRVASTMLGCIEYC
jgi:hypothetical protein